MEKGKNEVEVVLSSPCPVFFFFFLNFVFKPKLESVSAAEDFRLK